MIVWGMVAWWYSDGWSQCVGRMRMRLEATLDYFSFGLLIGTLFAPFRQISAGSVRGPIDVQVRAFLDRLISRFVGTVVRLVMLCIGGAVVLFNLVIALVILLGWLIIPFLPLVGFGVYLIGWLPWIS